MTAPLFDKILIANRGEIAVRIMQTCRELGIRTVAVYSDADVSALHVRVADEAYPIGPAPALESYLRIDALLDVAERSGAQAVHPGYGFLAENPEFARAVTDAGIVWIGPPADVITRMGDKLAAKRLAAESGVPVVPGYDGADLSPEHLQEEADRVGYPIMIKAAAGGGGKGMRIVRSRDDLAAAAAGAGREAAASFGDARIFLERALLDPRHIEIQIFADCHGRAVHLGERECSVQRRHQKVLEESPSPIMTPEIRSAMGEAALRVVRAARYVNAGTVEFLFAGDQFYFLEVNTRIQVEHPVTEMVTGLDMVRLQIEIAADRPLQFSQLDIQLRGHAIEARLYAEDPRTGFLPSTGTLSVFSVPEGPGIRNDVGVARGSEITPYYDPILAKLVVYAEDRPQAVARLRTALGQYSALGVTTNQAFLHWVTQTPAFTQGRLDTGFIDRYWPPPEEHQLPDEVILLAVARDLTQLAGANGEIRNPWRARGNWRGVGSARRAVYRWQDQDVAVAVTGGAHGSWTARIAEATYVFTAQTDESGRVTVVRDDGVISGFAVELGEYVDVSWQGAICRLERPSLSSESPGTGASRGQSGLSAPMPGKVVRVLVEPGQTVTQHEPLLVLEAMKMEHVIEAPRAGVVREILFGEGAMVPSGAALASLDES